MLHPIACEYHQMDWFVEKFVMVRMKRGGRDNITSGVTAALCAAATP